MENHPKVHDLGARMSWSKYETIGRLHGFWYWVLKYAPTGNLKKFNDAQLAGSVGLNASEGRPFVDAMVASCWIDRSAHIFRVHDWPRYAGRYLRDSKFKREPARWLETIGLYGITEAGSADPCRRIVGGQSAVTKPTNKHPPNPPPAGGGFQGKVSRRRKKPSDLSVSELAEKLQTTEVSSGPTTSG